MSKRPEPPMSHRPVTVAPDRYEANGATDGVTKICPRCEQVRAFGRPCLNCERVGLP